LKRCLIISNQSSLKTRHTRSRLLTKIRQVVASSCVQTKCNSRDRRSAKGPAMNNLTMNNRPWSTASKIITRSIKDRQTQPSQMLAIYLNQRWFRAARVMSLPVQSRKESVLTFYNLMHTTLNSMVFLIWFQLRCLCLSVVACTVLKHTQCQFGKCISPCISSCPTSRTWSLSIRTPCTWIHLHRLNLHLKVCLVLRLTKIQTSKNKIEAIAENQKMNLNSATMIELVSIVTDNKYKSQMKVYAKLLRIAEKKQRWYSLVKKFLKMPTKANKIN
jgi:hypothetical protein